MSKGLRALKRIVENGYISPDVKELKIIEKELKALEIIKKEPYLAINWYIEGTYEEYVDAIKTVMITKNEWDIAKEVLE